MCGIAGFVGRGDVEDLARMTGSLAHRGPDDAGRFHQGDLALFLGHRRLSIVDLDSGAQPMANEDGMVQVVFNGEIYNHLELRKALVKCGHRFRSDHSDTEVLVHGYEEWGEDLPLRLNGMFAFAIADVRHAKLFLARDRLGEKPLYYFAGPKLFAFASELSGLLGHRLVPRQVSKLGVQKLLAHGFIPAPSSILENVAKLAPGHSLTVEAPSLHTALRSYWTFRIEPDGDDATSDAQHAATLRHLVVQAVSRRLMSDVPLGIFLSGGVDSTIVLAAAAAGVPAGGIQTFSIGFNEPTFDESGFARLAAERFGTSHFSAQLDIGAARDLIEPVLARIDEPLGDPSILPTFLLSRFSRGRVKVALGGDGGDELFAGYDPFKALSLARLYATVVPGWIHRAGRWALDRLPASERNMSLEFRLKRTLRGLSYPPRLWNPAWLGPLDPAGLAELMGEPIRPDEVYAEAIEAWAHSHSEDLVDRTLEFYTRLYLPNNILTKVDRASMMVSLEARAPFLDNDLVEFVRRLPNRLKLAGRSTKVLLKSAFRDTVPREILARQKKGFGIPLAAWLRQWGDDAFLDSMPFADRGWLRARWREHLEGRADHRQLLWCALSMHSFVRSPAMKAR
jgi:asparagine synthase (glutamine-hydrolysing)